MTFIRVGDDRMLNLAQVQRAEVLEVDGGRLPTKVKLVFFAFESGAEDIELFEGDEAAAIWKVVEEQLG